MLLLMARLGLRALEAWRRRPGPSPREVRPRTNLDGVRRSLPPLARNMLMTPSITLLGTGGPRPDAARGATSLLIETGENAILIDAGRGVVRQLRL